VLLVGVHVSISGSIDKAVDRAKALTCTTFQIFTRNPRGWRYTPLDGDAVREFRRKVREYGYEVVVAHMPYLPNLASPKEEVYERSVASLINELKRCEELGIPYLVTHLGSHLGAGIKKGLERVAEAVRRALEETEGSDVMILLENTAGSKNGVGSRFEELGEVMKRLGFDRRIGLCFDTCHAYVAGYDIATPRGFERTLKDIDEYVGLDRLKVVHLNDSKGGLGSHLDRHEHIGLGFIGERGFRNILSNGLIRRLPLILETPVDSRRGDEGNIRKVRELAGEV